MQLVWFIVEMILDYVSRAHVIFQNCPSTQSISHAVTKNNLLAWGQNNTHYTCSRYKYCRLVQLYQPYSFCLCQECYQKAKIQYWLEKGVFFCCVSVPPGVSSPDNDGFGLAQHVNLSTNSVPRCCNVRKRQYRLFDQARGHFGGQVGISAIWCQPASQPLFDPLYSIEPETFHMTVA